MFQRTWASVSEFLREVVAEFKRVSFPSRSETVGSTTVVIVFCVIMSLFLFSVDQFLLWLVSKII